MDRAAREPRITLATTGHRDYVRRLSARVFARFGDYATMLPRMMRWPWMRTFVAEIDGQPVGFAMLSLEDAADGLTDLTAIAVAPEHQRRGVGRALLAHAESLTLDEVPPGSPAAVRLTVAEDNRRARSIFAAAGFRVQPGAEEAYPAGQRSLAMHKVLRTARLDSDPSGSEVE